MNNITLDENKQIEYVCELCEKQFFRPRQRGRKPRFCSRRCGDGVKVTYYQDKYKCKCKNCSNEYNTASRTSEFCSMSCAAVYRENKLLNKNCKACNVQFKGKESQFYCSDECKKEKRTCFYCKGSFQTYYYTDKKYCSITCVGKSKTTNEHKCEKCGVAFLGRKDRANRYCSRSCFFEQVGYKENDYKILSRLTDLSSYQRAEKYGVKRERIDVLEVFEKDNWICGICDGKIDGRLPHPNPLSASLDHIIPLSKGGTHTYDNVQCSHLGCNIKKNDTITLS